MRAIEVPEQSGKPRPSDEPNVTSSIEPIRSRGYERRLRDLLQKTERGSSVFGSRRPLPTLSRHRRNKKAAIHRKGEKKQPTYTTTLTTLRSQHGGRD